MEGLNPLDILIHIINFIVTFVLLYLLLYKPVSKFMHKRRESVEQALADAAATRAEADAYLAEAKAELAATGEKARRLSHEAIENAALDAERIVDTAQDEADALLQKAREQMRQEKQAAIERAHTEDVYKRQPLCGTSNCRNFFFEEVFLCLKIRTVLLLRSLSVAF